MKMYTVPENTMATAIHGPTGKTLTIATTRDNSFTETVTDPLAYKNGRWVGSRIGVSLELANWFNDKAKDRYYVFMDMENNSGWFLIVHESMVNIR